MAKRKEQYLKQKIATIGDNSTKFTRRMNSLREKINAIDPLWKPPPERSKEEQMLKEQVAKILPTTSLCEICYLHKPGNYTRKDCITYGKRLCAYEDMLVDQILNLFKAEVDKLTVINDEEIPTQFKLYEDSKPEIGMPFSWGKWMGKAQLQHTKKQLLDLMGE